MSYWNHIILTSLLKLNTGNNVELGTKIMKGMRGQSFCENINSLIKTGNILDVQTFVSNLFA